ncbi:MAG: hypothetical protein V4667_06180 [Bacteroidota bacterium]
MNFTEILSDKSLKPKQITEKLCDYLVNNPEQLNELIAFAEKSTDSAKATCIEAIEFATKKNTSIANQKMFDFVVNSLREKAPRVKWESAKVIANTVFVFSKNLDDSISNLLINTEHTGTVVRWSAASALGEIVKLKTKHNKELIPAIEAICKREEKKSIVKIYATALKKVQA